MSRRWFLPGLGLLTWVAFMGAGLHPRAFGGPVFAAVGRPPAGLSDPAPSPKTREPDLTLLRKGRREIRAKRLKRGVSHLQEFLKANPTHQRGWWYLSNASLRRRDWSTMHHALTQVLALDPDNVKARMRRSYAQLRKDGFDQTLLLPHSVDPGPAYPLENPEDERITLVAGGDLHLGRVMSPHQKALPTHGVAHWLRDIQPFIRQGEIAFANLETVLLDEGVSRKCREWSTACSAFKVPKAYAEGIGRVGFNLLSTANNHAFDFGFSGVVSTAEALNEATTHSNGPIYHSGATGEVAFWRIRGVRVSMVAFGTGSWLPYRVTDVEEAQKVVAALARQSEIVIVSVHGGAEGNSAQRVPEGRETFHCENRGDMRRFSHGVIDAGADLVLGHGPHVLRGMELYQDRIIAYSLGNLSSYRTLAMGHPKNISALLQIELTGTGRLVKGRVVPLILSRAGRPGLDPKGRAVQKIRYLSGVDFPGTALPLDRYGVIRQEP